MKEKNRGKVFKKNRIGEGPRRVEIISFIILIAIGIFANNLKLLYSIPPIIAIPTLIIGLIAGSVAYVEISNRVDIEPLLFPIRNKKKDNH